MSKQIRQSGMLDMKIDNYMQSQAKTEAGISIKQWKVDYYKNMDQYLNNVLKELNKTANIMQNINHNNTRSKNIKSLMSPQSLLSQLTKQALCWKNNNKILHAEKHTEIIQSNQCRISAHIKQIFMEQKQMKNQQKQLQKMSISELKNLKKQITEIISKQLEESEPYMHEKMMKKILKQTKKQGKIQVINTLSKLVEQKKKIWLVDKNNKMQQKHSQQKISSEISSNLEKMKQIMNKKVAIDTQITSTVQDLLISDFNTGNKLERRIQSRMANSVIIIEEKIQENTKKFQQTELQYNLGRMNKQNKRSNKNIQIITEQQLLNLKELTGQCLEALIHPLETNNYAKLQREAEEIERQLNAYEKKVKKI